MKRAAQFFFLLILSISVYIGCQTTSTNNDVTVTGIVIDATSGDPISQAIVEITSPTEFSGTAKVTDANGSFSFSLTVTESPTLNISIRKSGYIDGSIDVPVSGGLEITLDQPVQLSLIDTGDGGDGGDGEEVSGPSEGAATIELLTISPTTLNIRETGGNVNSTFSFQVQDSSGRNLDLNNAVDVTFTIVSGPNGGEGIIPETVRTNAAGIARSSLFAGELAGVVQIQAEIVREDVNLTITSSPVAVTIHGGFPTQDGFYLTSDQTNLESSNSQESTIIAKMVDQFSNPVKPGTAVYFNTTIGSIEGSNGNQSDDNGEVPVSFWCDGNLGSGVITARTVDQNNQEITAQLPVVCSASNAIISVSPSTFSIQQGESQRFDFTVTDVTGQPMAKGTTIRVVDTADDSYDVDGNTNITVPNATLTGDGVTDFSFVLQYFGSDDGDIIIPIVVKSPSGQETTLNVIGNSSNVEISGPSEGAAAIELQTISETRLNVAETGGITNSVITFVVRDSSGRSIDIENQIQVNFEVATGPGGGEGVLPTSVLTDAAGLASTNFFSGDSSGVVQIRAYVDRPEVGLTIESKPVAIAIDGGFPTLEGFEVSLSQRNLELGQDAQVDAKLIDQFGNPVKVGTAVYFTTDFGSVDAVGYTDEFGIAKHPTTPGGFIFQSCEGLGNAELGGDGTLRVTTADADENEIAVEVPFTCSSSEALITATPTDFQIDAGDSQTFNFTVTNKKGGPMAAGTEIRVTSDASVTLSGDTFVSLGDYLSGGQNITEFSFTLEDFGTTSEDVVIEIEVETPLFVTTIYEGITGEIFSEGSGGGVSGPPTGAAAIILNSVSEDVINIQGTGGIVNSAFTFQVQDSAGRDLDLNNQTLVNFSILVGPDGGEGLLPESATTNSSGRVTTSLFSGTKAGVVQVQAEIVRDELDPPLIIRSQPVAVTIHGGFPDEDHFSLAPDKYNFEGYTINGNTNQITAIIGDEFSNPVKPGTAVYFSSTGGIIEGSGQGNTNNQGFVTVQLISGGPRPNDSETIDGTPFPRPGLGTVTASTVDKDNNLISKSVNVVFSTSSAIISTDSTTFDLPPNGGVTFDYEVTDLNGNPMAAGTTISIDAGAGMEVTGDGNVTLGNNIFPGPGATEFTFSIRDIDDESNDPAALSISITVTSPQGNVTTLTPITGTRRKTF